MHFELAVRVLAIACRTWRALLWLITVKKTWRWPRASKVLIFDAEGGEFLLDYLAPWQPEILHVRGERLNVPVLLACIISGGPLNRNRYFDCFIKQVGARLVVTFIDNNAAFYSLAARNPSVKTLFVQNGLRSYYSDVFEVLDRPGTTERRSVNYMMTFGVSVGAEYKRHIEGNVVSIGSLRNNSVPRQPRLNQGTLVFASQFRTTPGFSMHDRFYSFEEFFYIADRIVVPFLQQYAKTHGKKLVIVPFFGADPKNLAREQIYYERLLGEPCQFSDWRWHGSSYEAVDAAEVFVSIDSTLGYEAAARGTKTALFPIRAKLLALRGLTYGWPSRYPEEGPFWTGRPDPDAFKRILDHLYAISEEQWQVEASAEGLSDLMAYDPGNRILQSVLIKELGIPDQLPSTAN